MDEGYRSRYSEDDDGEYTIIETIEYALTLDHWSDNGDKRSLFDKMQVDEEEVVSSESLMKVKPEQNVSDYM